MIDTEMVLFYAIITMVILLLAIFGFTALKMYYQFKTREDLISKVKGNAIMLSKLKGDVKRIKEEGLEAEVVDLNTGNPLNLDFTNLTLEQAAETLGLDQKQLNNPIIRPIAEKIFNQIKNKQQQPEEPQDTGY